MAQLMSSRRKLRGRARARRRGDVERLLEQLRALVRDTHRRRKPGARSRSPGANRREIERLKARLAELVKRDPTGDWVARGRLRTSVAGR
jgi:hypothetical protein